MKATMTPSRIPLRHTALKTAACVSTLAVLLALATTVRAQVEYDNFDSGALDPAVWTTISNPNYPNTISFVPDAFGGKAIRMQAPPPHNPYWPPNTARCLVVNTNNTYTNFYVAADLLHWDSQPYKSTNCSFNGVVARATETLSSVYNLSGVALMYWVNEGTQEGSPARPGIGAMAMGYFVFGVMRFEFPQATGGVVPAAVAYWTLQTNHTYRLVFQGVGRNLTGSVYDTQDLTQPLGTLQGDTSLEDFGGGFVWPAPTNGYSGLFSASYLQNNDSNGIVDATFDNFYAAAAPPTTVTAPATPHGMIGAPQVVNRTPASWANFYSAAGGISFSAATLTTTNNLNISAIRLILNGVDVTSGCIITPTTPPTNAAVTFNGLVTNLVYDAMIILEDSNNRWTTNVWTFDTFSAAYLASASCKNVECEDYDIGGGFYFDLPVAASGYSTNDNTWMIPAGAWTNLNYCFPINIANGFGADYGYVGQNGNNDRTTPPGDFYQCNRTNPLVGAPITPFALSGNLNSLLPGCEYRTGEVVSDPSGLPWFAGTANGDVVGTERGAAYAISVQNILASGFLLIPQYTFDTKRDKYVALNAVGLAQYPVSSGYNPSLDLGSGFGNATGADATPWWDVEEYNVVYTEGSDWFNYTHNWGSSKSYLVYLRAGCSLSQTVNLYQGATTNRASLLGTFSCTNALAWNWRYTPLRDNSGNLKVVTLSGTSTLRLEIAPDNPEWLSVRNGLALNYLAFVPFVPGSLQVNITPAGAVGTAQWQVDGGTLQNSGATVSSLPTGFQTVTFTTVAGYTTPASQYVTVSAGGTATATGAYVANGPTLWSTAQIQKSGTSWAQETGVTVNTGTKTITLTQLAASRYYQLRSATATTITGVSCSSGNVVLTYQ